MQRYFIPDHQFEIKTVRILGNDARHIQKVMRMDIGSQIICCNENREAFLCKIDELNGEEVRAMVDHQLTEQTELPIDVTIAQALPKGEKLDYVIQKGTECGADSFILFSSERSIVKWQASKLEKKLERMEKIAKEAAEQSHRNVIPKINFVKDLKQLICFSHSFNHKLIAYEEEAKAGKQKQLPMTLSEAVPGDRLLIMIGPEGGLSPGEVNQLKQANFLTCALGRRILRTETASTYVLAAISYQYELLNEVNK